jgi:hypothetical protein
MVLGVDAGGAESLLQAPWPSSPDGGSDYVANSCVSKRLNGTFSSRSNLREEELASSVAKVSQALILAAALVGGFPTLVRAQLNTEQDVRRTLEREGYRQVQDVKFTSEAIIAKAVKDGKQVSLMLDPTGKIKRLH